MSDIITLHHRKHNNTRACVLTYVIQAHSIFIPIPVPFEFQKKIFSPRQWIWNNITICPDSAPFILAQVKQITAACFTIRNHEGQKSKVPKTWEKGENTPSGMEIKCHMFESCFYKVNITNGKTVKREWSPKSAIFSEGADEQRPCGAAVCDHEVPGATGGTRDEQDGRTLSQQHKHRPKVHWDRRRRPPAAAASWRGLDTPIQHARGFSFPPGLFGFFTFRECLDWMGSRPIHLSFKTKQDIWEGLRSWGRNWTQTKYFFWKTVQLVLPELYLLGKSRCMFFIKKISILLVLGENSYLIFIYIKLSIDQNRTKPLFIRQQKKKNEPRHL